MKYALITLIAVLLLIGEGCDGDDNTRTQDCERDGETCPADEAADVARPDAEEKPALDEPKSDEAIILEAEAMVNAQKWVKEAEGLLEDALQTQGSSTHKVESLQMLAKLQANTGNPETAKKNFNRALDLVSEKVRANKAGVLTGIALAASDAKLYDMVEDIASMTKGSRKSKIYSRILEIKIIEQDFTEAKRIAKESGIDKFYILITKGQSAAGLFEDANNTASFLLKRNPYLAIIALCEIAKYQTKSGEKKAGAKTFERAKAVLKDSKSINNKGFSYTHIAQAQAEVGMFDAALRTLEQTKDGYNTYPVLIMIAQHYYEANDKNKSAELLEKAKKDARNLNLDHGKIKGLCEVAVAESKFVGKVQARKTLQEARKIYEENMHTSVRLSGLSVEERFVLRGEFAAGFSNQVETEINNGIFLHKTQALAEIALLYAKAGDFAQAHRVLKSISKEDKSAPLFGVYYHYYLDSIANLEVNAGVLKYLQALITEFENITRLSRTHFTIANVLARAGLEDQLDKAYASVKDMPADRRFHFCLGAAQGFLTCSQDKKNR